MFECFKNVYCRGGPVAGCGDEGFGGSGGDGAAPLAAASPSLPAAQCTAPLSLAAAQGAAAEATRDSGGGPGGGDGLSGGDGIAAKKTCAGGGALTDHCAAWALALGL